MDQNERLRRLPAVDRLLQTKAVKALKAPRSLVKTAVRQALEAARAQVLAGQEPDLSLRALAAGAAEIVEDLTRPRFRPVVNATGVVIHTNLGRSLLARSAVAAVGRLSSVYANLEYDLAEGRRGSRYSHVVDLLKELTGAEAGLVVNNNAAAVVLALNTLAQGREVVVSRGQLVEIGGSFRMPEVMVRAGAILREVGATNKTHLGDYRAAVNERTAGLLKVHQSNFAMVGFQKIVPLSDMVGLAREKGLWVMEDLGSGCLVDLSAHGLLKEPTVREVVAEGADVVTFSGDKLLGGPQAGIIVGRAELVGQIQKNPLNRALRIDKMTLAALEATLRLYRDEAEAIREIPTLRMLCLSQGALRTRALALRDRLRRLDDGRLELALRPGLSQVGGGALPLQSLPTRLVGLKVKGFSAARLEEAFRRAPRPVVGRVEQDWFLFDPRTLLPQDLSLIAQALKAILTQEQPS